MLDIEKINQKIVLNLNISDLPEDTQDDIIDMLGKNILEKVILEVFKQIPEDERKTFKFLNSSIEIKNFVSKYISDYDAFIQTIIDKEIIKFKKEAGLV